MQKNSRKGNKCGCVRDPSVLHNNGRDTTYGVASLRSDFAAVEKMNVATYYAYNTYNGKVRDRIA